MTITLNTMTMEKALEKAANKGYNTIFDGIAHRDIDEFDTSDFGNEEIWIIIGDRIINAEKIATDNPESYDLDF